MADSTFIGLLQKVMAFHAWDVQQPQEGEERLVDLLLAQMELAEGCQSLETAVKEAVEAEDRAAQEDKEKKPFKGTKLPPEPPEAVDEGLYKRLRLSRPLRKKLLTEPALSAVALDMMRIAVRLADVAPNGEQTMMDSGDALFRRVLERWRQEPVTAEKLLTDDMVKLQELFHYAPHTDKSLSALAADEKWQELLESAENVLENGPAEPQPPPVQGFLDEINGIEDAVYRKTATDLLLSHPRLSAMPPLLVTIMTDPKGYAGLFPEPVEALRREWPDRTDSIIQEYRYRLAAADHFLTLRKFAKLDALDYKWPDLYRRFNVDRTAVVNFEQYLNQQGKRDEIETQPEAVQRLYGAYKDDEDLVRFLHLRPLLDEIYEDERKRYQRIQTTTSPGMQPVQEQAAVKGLALEASQTLDEAVRTLPEALETVVIRFNGSPSMIYQVTISNKGKTSDAGAFSVDWESLRDQESKLLVRLGTNEPLEKRFEQFGRWLCFRLFEPETQKMIVEALDWQTDQKTRRVLFEFGEETQLLQEVPWESLYLPGPVDRLIFGSSHYSTMRLIPGKANEIIYPDSGPLRVLVVIQAPRDGSETDPGYERSNVMRMMEDPNFFEVKYLTNGSWASFQHEVQGSFPHIVHFVAPPNPIPNDPNFYFSFVDDNGKSDLKPAALVGDFMWTSQVKMVTLAPSGTPTVMNVVDKQILRGAVDLAGVGLPAVVGPVRTGITSVPFHRTMYGALAAGESVEAAVLAGRRALKAENQAWIRYALFAGVTEPVKLIV